MLGAIIGDIIGSRFEFNNTDSTDFDLFTPECSFTDDTVCTIAIADALLRGINSKDSLLSWCKRYPNPMGGYGASFARWIHSFDHQPYNSFGNGSAMRVAPIGWWYDGLVERAAEETASCTHDHPEGIKGAKAVAVAIRELSKHKDLSHLARHIDFFYYPGFMKADYTKIKGVFNETCQGTVPLCIWIVCTSTSFEDAIRKAISWGGDSDTIGAIVGSMAEAAFGIPDSIVHKALEYLDRAQLRVVLEFYYWLSKYEYEVR